MLDDWFRLIAVAATALPICALAAPASHAQQWPTHPVRFVLPFGPGSGADTGARLIADKLQQEWRQPIVSQLSAAVSAAIREPDVAKRFADMSANAVGDTPAEMATFLHQERERWGKVIRISGAKAE